MTIICAIFQGRKGYYKITNTDLVGRKKSKTQIAMFISTSSGGQAREFEMN